MPTTSPGDRLPSLLISYVNLKPFFRNRGFARFRSWVMDSGAYSALTSGVKIDLSRYIDDALGLQATDPTLEAVFALDVIGDPETSIRNAERMIANGVRAIPTFHHGSPMHYLPAVAKLSDRMALGGLVQRGAGGHGAKIHQAQRLDFLNRCFAAVWPKWIHGFGCADPRLFLKVPFASVDSTSWYYSAARYGKLIGIGPQLLPRRADAPSAFDAGILCNIAYHADHERKARESWRRRMAPAGIEGPAIRLASSGVKAEMRLIGAYAAATADRGGV